MSLLVPVILSGGAGTRLWPLSREMYPSNCWPSPASTPCCRIRPRAWRASPAPQPPIVVCNEAHRFTVAEQIRALGLTPSAILLEPVGRNTAPAVALAALKAQQIDAEATLVVAPADHVIRDARAFQAAAEVGIGFGAGRQARDLRHRRARAGNRLRLHPPRRGQGPCLPGGAVHRKAAARSGHAVRRLGRLLLEQRHVRVQGRAAIWRSLRPSRRTFSRPPRRRSRRPSWIWISRASTRLNSRNAAASRSTMR